MTQPYSAIPGPQELPIVGGLMSFADDPLTHLRTLAEHHGPMVRFSFLGRRFLLVSDPDLVREVLVEQADIFQKSQRDVHILSKFLGKGLLTNAGDSHKRQRKLAQPAFHARRIQAYADTMVAYTAAMLDGWSTGERRDLAEEMRQLTLYIVAKTLFDADRQQMAGFVADVGAAMHDLQAISDAEFNEIVPLPDWLPIPRNGRRRRASATLDATIRQVVDRRRAQAIDGQPPDKGDLLSMLMLAHDEEGQAMDAQQLRDELVTIFVAGHETTSNALSWTWYLLMQHPAVEQRLHAEVDAVLGGRLPGLADLPQLPYTLRVLKEGMRLYPPAWVLNAREPRQATELGGYTIPAGTQLFVSPYVMHRQARFFPAPDEFQPDRWTDAFEAALPRYAYLPFGGGPRICIGNSFAMMEAQLILATMAARYRFDLLPAPRVATAPMITLGPKEGLPVRVAARSAHDAQKVEAGMASAAVPA